MCPFTPDIYFENGTDGRRRQEANQILEPFNQREQPGFAEGDFFLQRSTPPTCSSMLDSVSWSKNIESSRVSKPKRLFIYIY